MSDPASSSAGELRPTQLQPAHGGACAHALLRHEPEDFQVDEILPFVPPATGEHLMVQVRKTGWNTEDVARRLAEQAGVRRGGVSYAGLKDRHAVTTQWFSVHSPKPLPSLCAGSLLGDGVEVLSTVRNPRKLRRGALAGNRFCLRLRRVAPFPGAGGRKALDRRLEQIAQHGVPNYFGPQRFGRAGRNLEQANAWLLHGHPVRGRNVRGLLISALRAELFNRVLTARVANGTWSRLIPGDRAILDGRGSHFPVESVDPTLTRRLAVGNIHPTGPLPGVVADEPVGRVAELEAGVLRSADDWVEALRERGVRADRRALRLMPRRLAWRWSVPDELLVSFALPPGAYATTVIAEAFAVETR